MTRPDIVPAPSLEEAEAGQWVEREVYGGRFVASRIERTTKLYLVVGDTRYSRRSGFVPGDTWHSRGRISAVSRERLKELIEAAARERLLAKVRTGLGALSLADLRKVAEMIEGENDA